jgi:glycosyltransferase involved in cell wall biosynthesis
VDQGEPGGAGAGLQMVMLAQGLSAQGLGVAHIVWPVANPRQSSGSGPVLVTRPRYEGTSARGRIAELLHVWRSLRDADSRVYVVRGGGPQLAVTAAFCWSHRRKFVFSSAGDIDFDFKRPDQGPLYRILARFGARRADLIVAQRDDQAGFAEKAGLGPVAVIPSFAEPAEVTSAQPEAFLWIGRLVGYKRPLEYVRLARALPDASFRMVCIDTEWETPGELRTRLIREAAQTPNLELLAPLPRAKVLDLISRANAVVSTSTAEGMPNIFLEAWSQGVPVMSLEYDPDGVIDSRGLGYAARGSLQVLERAARKLLSDPEERRQRGKHGRQYVREVHAPAKVTARWAELLSDLLAAPG